jgi:zinc protease
MMQEIRVKRGWTYGASNSFRFGTQPRHFAMYYFPKTADTVPAINLSLKLFEDFVNNGIKPEEYEFAKQSLVNNAPFNYDTPRKRLENATTEYLINFPRGYFKDFASNIDRVSYGDIAPSLKSLLDTQDLALTVVGDKAKLEEGVKKLPGFSAPVSKSYLED